MTERSIAQKATEASQLLVPEPFLAPSLFHSLFWKPRFLVDSPVTAYLPLLFWLSSVLRPRHVGVLGCDDGAAHFAFCQALDHLGIEGNCQGFGFWQDPEADNRGGAVPKILAQHQEMLYEGKSQLVPCAGSVDAAFRRMKAGGLDLLFCDLASLPDKGHASGEHLLGYLSTPGILVIHGTRPTDGESADVEGIHRFLAARPHVDFPDEQGLTLLCNSDDMPAPLISLFDAAPGGVLRRDVEQVFRRSGQGLRAAAAAIASAEAHRQAHRTIAEIDSSLKQAKAAIEAALAERDAARKAESETLEALAQSEAEQREMQASMQSERNSRFKEVGAMTRICEELRATQAETEAALAAARTETEAARAAQAETEAALAAARAETEAARTAQAETEAMLAGRNAMLKAEQELRVEETSALTLICEELRAAQAETEAALAAARAGTEAGAFALEEERKARFQETEALTRMAQALEKEKAAAQQECQSLKTRIRKLHESTSWRVTAPVRVLKRTFSRSAE